MTAPHEDDLRTAMHEARVAITLIELAVSDRRDGYPVTCEHSIMGAVERLDAATTALGGPTVADFRAVLLEVLDEAMPGGRPFPSHHVRDWIDGNLLFRAEALLSRTSPRCKVCADQGAYSDHVCSCPAGDRYRNGPAGNKEVKATAARPAE